MDYTEEDEIDHKYVQTTMSLAQFDEVEQYLLRKGIKNRRAWIRTLILKEVRNDGAESLPLHR